MDDRRIPVVLLTGFLGSGKTSLLKALLGSAEMAGCAVLINEVGAVGLDHLLVQEVAEDITLLESGCLCCAVRGDLTRSLRELFMRRLARQIDALDRVVIETTGLADPAPVIHTLQRDFFLAERFRLEGVITTVDVRHVHWQLGQHQEAIKQVAMADRIVLTKCDLADSFAIAEAEEKVATFNPTAPCWQGEPGKVPAGLLLGLGIYAADGKTPEVARWLGEAALRERSRMSARLGVFGQAAAAPEQALHDDKVSTEVLEFTRPFQWWEFVHALDTLQSVLGDRILRIKGLLAVQGEDAPRVIHCVGHDRYPEQQLEQWPDEDHRSRLVFIVRDLPRSVLDKTFAAFCTPAA